MKFWLWGKCLRILLLQKLFSHSWLEKENDWSKEGELSRISNWFRKGFTDQQVLFVRQSEFACNSKTTSSFQTEMGKGIKSGWYLQNFKVLLKSEWLASNFTNPRDSEWALTASLVVWPVLCTVQCISEHVLYISRIFQKRARKSFSNTSMERCSEAHARGVPLAGERMFSTCCSELGADCISRVLWEALDGALFAEYSPISGNVLSKFTLDIRKMINLRH